MSNAVNSHTLRLLSSVEHSCNRFLSKRSNLEELQADIEPVLDSLETQAEEGKLEKALRHLANQLEYIRFTVDDSRYVVEARREIERFRKIVNTVR